MATMQTSKPIQIFKPGRHTAMSGAALSFSETDLSATAAAYDPAKHEAPLVCGHPEHDAPAYGWVGALSFADGALEAAPTQVDPAFAEMVGKGSFKKISASFYAPDSPSNPVPGVYYLRHVGFLGAMPPGVKGLRNPAFADGEQGIVEFGEYDEVVNAGILRSLRDWIIGKFGLADADQAIPAYDVATLENIARQPEPEKNDPVTVTPSFIEKGSTVTPEEKAALEAENAQMKQQLADVAARDKATAAATRHAGHASFAEGLVTAGTLLPAHKAVVVASLDHLAGSEQVIEFGEGDAKQPLVEALKAMLTNSSKLVSFGETAGADKTLPQGVVNFAGPSGHAVDAEALVKLAQAQAYMKQNNVSFETAIQAVEG